METYQYYSKWRKKWVDFNNQPPGEGEIYQMKKSYYRIRVKKRKKKLIEQLVHKNPIEYLKLKVRIDKLNNL